jgi:hypothetical protein
LQKRAGVAFHEPGKDRDEMTASERLRCGARS